LLPLFAIVAVAAALMAAALLFQAGPAFLARRALTAALAVLLLARASTWSEDLVYAMNIMHAPGARVTTFKHASDNVTYIEETGRSRIIYNGHPSIIVSQGGIPNPAEVVLGLLAAAAAPRTESALVLGLGAGITAGAVARLFGSTDVVEINRAFFPLLPSLADADFALSENPAARLIHDDGRRFLAAAHARYDAIVNTLPSPTFYAAGKLYTDEFYALVKRALAPDGVYLTWFTFGDMSQAGVGTQLATLRRRFRHCALAVLRDSYYVLGCSDRPPRPREPGPPGLPAPIREVLARHAPSAEPERLCTALWLSPDVFGGSGVWDAPSNTDDLPLLEFQIARRTPGRVRTDEVARDPRRFGLRLPEPRDPDFLDRALLLADVHRLLFRTRVLPHLERDPALKRAFLNGLSRSKGPASP
ncbi:MAG: hypothetical protein ABII00_01130, partial [Elusimicrobiota bacterium]